MDSCTRPYFDATSVMRLFGRVIFSRHLTEIWGDVLRVLPVCGKLQTAADWVRAANYRTLLDDSRGGVEAGRLPASTRRSKYLTSRAGSGRRAMVQASEK